MQAIVNSRSLRASDILQMNDPQEIVYPYDEIIRPITETRHRNGQPVYFIRGIKDGEIIEQVWGEWCTHIACLSGSAHIPSQWQRYADGGTGCALGFDRQNLEAWSDFGRKASLIPMVYNQARQSEAVKRLFVAEAEVEDFRKIRDPCLSRNRLRKKAINYLAVLACTFKAPSWQTEQEWRILIIQTADEQRYQPLRRPDGVCYFDLPIVVPQLLTELILGPNCTVTDSEAKSLLSASGLGTTSVVRSKVVLISS